ILRPPLGRSCLVPYGVAGSNQLLERLDAVRAVQLVRVHGQARRVGLGLGRLRTVGSVPTMTDGSQPNRPSDLQTTGTPPYSSYDSLPSTRNSRAPTVNAKSSSFSVICRSSRQNVPVSQVGASSRSTVSRACS